MARPRTRRSQLAGLRAAFWLVPAAFSAGAVLLAIGLSVLELRLALPINGILPSGPAGARSLLSSIITAMISFTALVFSITVVALQLASSQYSPRVLRTFLEDRVTQSTLGTFVATFLFAMVVLAALPDRSSARLPELSLAVAMVLVLVSSTLFIYYLHHITTTMRVSHITAAIAAQTRGTIGEQYPDDDSEVVPVSLAPPDQTVCVELPGLVDDIDLHMLARLARRHGCAMSVLPAPGDFVVAGQPLLTVHPLDSDAHTPVVAAEAASVVTISIERTPGQDVGFGFRQLGDIAERALSPGINDTTTAVRAVQEMHDLLRRLAVRRFHPWVVRDNDGTVRARAERQSFESFLAIAVDDVRRAARDNPRINRLLAETLADLRTVALPEHLPAIVQRIRA